MRFRFHCIALLPTIISVTATIALQCDVRHGPGPRPTKATPGHALAPYGLAHYFRWASGATVRASALFVLGVRWHRTGKRNIFVARTVPPYGANIPIRRPATGPIASSMFLIHPRCET